MDFHALPRRDLQALCKRNGVRANMTNVAMADALGALPTVDGVEQFIKQPAVVPVPADKGAVAEEEVRREKQGSPLPRGRRVTSKPAESVKTNEGKGKEIEKADAKQESSKVEDAPALAVGRRGPGRRARPASVVVNLAAKPLAAAEETQGSPLPRTRYVTLKSSGSTKQNSGDEEEKEDAKPESNKEEDAPAIGVGRRGASRRARPAPAVATSVAGPAVKTAEVEDKQGSPSPRARRVTVKSSQPDKGEGEDDEEETEDQKLEANKEDAAAQGGVRRGRSRRARPAPAVSKPTAKEAVEDKEDLGSPPPRGRRVTGRRGVSRRAQPEPAVSAPVGEVAAEAAEPDGGEEEDEEDPKLEEKVEDTTAHGVPSPVEAPVTRTRAAASSTEERNVTLQTVLIRSTRQRRPTMKAAAAEEVVPQRAIKQAAARNNALPQGKGQEESLGSISDAVFLPSASCDKGCDDPDNVVQNKVIGEPKQRDKEAAKNEDEVPMEQSVTLDSLPIRPTRTRRPTMKVAATEKVPRRAIKKATARNSTLQQEKELEELLGAVSDAVSVPTLASDKGCDDPENVVKATDPQNNVQSEVIDEPKQDNDEELAMNEEEVLIEENPTEVAAVTDQECVDKSPLQELQVDVKHCATPFVSQDDSPILGLVSTPAGQAVEEDSAGTGDGLLEKGISEDLRHAADEMDLVPVIQELRASPAPDESIEKSCFTGHAAHNEIESSNEVLHGTDEINEVDSEYCLVSEEQGDVDDGEVLPGSDEITKVNSEDGLICQGKETVVDCKVLPEPMIQTIALDCSGYNSPVAEKEEKAVETMVSQSVENEAFIDDTVSPVTITDSDVEMVNVEELITKGDVEEKNFPIDFGRIHEQMEVVNSEKAEKVTETLPQSTASVDEDIEENDYQTDFLHVDGLKEDTDMESLSKITITESMVSQDKDIPVCKNSSENTAEPVCKDSSENTDGLLCEIKSESNTTELVAMDENKVVKVAKKSADLNKLSLGQLRAELKKKLERKAGKRVALARVDENVCRLNATGQEQVRKLQQY